MDKSQKKNLRRISTTVTAQTLYNLEKLAAACGYKDIGRVIDKLTREKMLDNRNLYGTKERKIDYE